MAAALRLRVSFVCTTLSMSGDRQRKETRARGRFDELVFHTSATKVADRAIKKGTKKDQVKTDVSEATYKDALWQKWDYLSSGDDV